MSPKGLAGEDLLQFIKFKAWKCRAISSALWNFFFENKQIPDDNHYYFPFVSLSLPYGLSKSARNKGKRMINTPVRISGLEIFLPIVLLSS